MKLGIPGILGLGCLMLFLVLGCESEKNSVPDSLKASPSGITQTNEPASVILPESDYSQDTTNSISPEIKEYQHYLILYIKTNWQDEIKQAKIKELEKGKVALKFWLHYDGTIHNVQVVESNVGSTETHLCEMAVRESAQPFWPPDMLHQIGTTQIQINMTFEYSP
jgi:hypothetical protein